VARDWAVRLAIVEENFFARLDLRPVVEAGEGGDLQSDNCETRSVSRTGRKSSEMRYLPETTIT